MCSSDLGRGLRPPSFQRTAARRIDAVGQGWRTDLGPDIEVGCLKDIFLINQIDVLRGATVLLIDDVVTTGASLSEAAKTLKKAGAKSVSAAVYAVARLN